MCPALYNHEEINIPLFHDLLPRIENQNFWEGRLQAEPDLPHKQITVRLHYNKTVEEKFEYDSSFTIHAKFPQNYAGIIALVKIHNPRLFNIRFKPIRRWTDKTLFFGADYRSYHSMLPLHYFSDNREDCRCECARCQVGFCENCCEY